MKAVSSSCSFGKFYSLLLEEERKLINEAGESLERNNYSRKKQQ